MAVELFFPADGQTHDRPGCRQARGIASVTTEYVHGYGDRESDRLHDQAKALADLLHCDTAYPAGSRVLEAGCGVGAQTVTLARNSPGASIVSIDVSGASLAQARARVEAAGIDNVEFREGDIFDLGFGPASFDHVFVCFVLEHLTRPADALRALKTVLRPAGTITVIEGDHGSAYFHPDSAEAATAIAALVQVQAATGGNALIGRQLYPLLVAAGFAEIRVSPRMVYADASRPELVEGFTKKTFTAMVEGVRDTAVASGLVEADVFEAGIRALYRTAAEDGVFCYTFFKGVGRIEANPGDRR